MDSAREACLGSYPCKSGCFRVNPCVLLLFVVCHLLASVPPKDPLLEARFFTDNKNRTHRDGYEIAGLGPPRLWRQRNVRARANPD
jgi:hypothetical protein